MRLTSHNLAPTISIWQDGRIFRLDAFGKIHHSLKPHRGSVGGVAEFEAVGVGAAAVIFGAAGMVVAQPPQRIKSNVAFVRRCLNDACEIAALNLSL
jgi:hypothetical protein